MPRLIQSSMLLFVSAFAAALCECLRASLLEHRFVEVDDDRQPEPIETRL
jgi:hypothetical protein